MQNVNGAAHVRPGRHKAVQTQGRADARPAPTDSVLHFSVFRV